MNSETAIRTVRTELVEVQSRTKSNGGGAARCAVEHPRSVKKGAALPLDRLRANGSPNDFGRKKSSGFLRIYLRASN